MPVNWITAYQIPGYTGSGPFILGGNPINGGLNQASGHTLTWTHSSSVPRDIFSVTDDDDYLNDPQGLAGTNQTISSSGANIVLKGEPGGNQLFSSPDLFGASAAGMTGFGGPAGLAGFGNSTIASGAHYIAEGSDGSKIIMVLGYVSNGSLGSFFMPVGADLVDGVTYTMYHPNDPNAPTGPYAGGATSGSVFSEGTVRYDQLIPCFTEGTRIATMSGEVAIEDIQVGDMVITRDGGLQPVRWIGSTTVPARGKHAPVVFAPGAIGNSRQLEVSPQHRILQNNTRAQLYFDETEVLLPAHTMVNSDTIYRREGGTVRYFHLLFDQHEIVLSEGVWTESFFLGDGIINGMAEAQRAEILSLFPELAEDVNTFGETARRALKPYEASLFLHQA